MRSVELFLVQHGRAKAKTDDPRRPLTSVGKEEVERIGAWVCSLSLSVRQILHSGKLRAEQTAQILANHLKPSGGVLCMPGLSPNDDVEPVVRIAETELADSMLVGHLPFLSRLVGFLVTGNPEIQIVRFCNGGIVGLKEEEGSWTINWAMRPDLVL